MAVQDGGFEPELVAPCGMNCGVCASYLALRHDLKSRGLRLPYCEGCRPRDKECAFLRKRCNLLLQNQVMFCYECESFPCERLRSIDEKYRKFFRMSMLDNLEFIRKHGVADFLKAQEEKWRCPECGGTICCHNGLCFNCNLDKLQGKKKPYRWE